MHAYLTRHKRLFADKNDVPLGVESYGLPKPPRDPHDIEGRKWWRRSLIFLCLVGFFLILLPQDMRDRLNGRQYSVTEGMTKVEVQRLKEVCAYVEIVGLKRPIECQRCVVRNDDGSTFTREGC